MAELLTSTPRRVLAVYAHPDDSDVSCGGSLARWAVDGSDVHVLVCTQGDKGSTDKGIDVDDLIRRRANELSRSQEVLRVKSVRSLAHRDGELENDLGLREEIVRVIRALQPDAIVCPDPLAVFFGEHYYNHRDHRVVGWAALDAASPAASSPLYFPDAGPPCGVEVAYLSGSLEPNVFVDISQTIERKTDAIMCHASQLGEAGESFRRVFYERAEEAGRSVGVPFAEAFRRIYLGA